MNDNTTKRIKLEINYHKLPSKKNDVEVSCRNGYAIKYKSKKITDWESVAIPVLIAQKRKLKIKTIEIPCAVKYVFYLRERITVRDKDNIEASVNDVLQAAEIIKNDALIYKSCSEKIFRKGKEEQVVIEIYNV